MRSNFYGNKFWFPDQEMKKAQAELWSECSGDLWRGGGGPHAHMHANDMIEDYIYYIQ